MSRAWLPTRDVKQWKQACREVGIDASEAEDRPSEDFHAEKRAVRGKGHWPYRNLINWLRTVEGRQMAVVIPDISPTDLLGRFRGTIVDAAPGYPEVLHLR